MPTTCRPPAGLRSSAEISSWHSPCSPAHCSKIRPRTASHSVSPPTSWRCATSTAPPRPSTRLAPAPKTRTSSDSLPLRLRIWRRSRFADASHVASVAENLVGQGRGVIGFPQRFDNRGGVHSYRAVVGLVIDVAADEALDVAVEDQPDELAGAVHHGRAGVAADDVVRRHE